MKENYLDIFEGRMQDHSLKRVNKRSKWIRRLNSLKNLMILEIDIDFGGGSKWVSQRTIKRNDRSSMQERENLSERQIEDPGDFWFDGFFSIERPNEQISKENWNLITLISNLRIKLFAHQIYQYSVLRQFPLHFQLLLSLIWTGFSFRNRI